MNSLHLLKVGQEKNQQKNGKTKGKNSEKTIKVAKIIKKANKLKLTDEEMKAIPFK